MEDRLTLMLNMQRTLQDSMPDAKGIMELRGDERAAVTRNMVLACEDELHEAMAETGWKPWATSRHWNQEEFMKEMVDAWHFFMNLMLLGAGELEWSVEQLADEFTKRYITKNAVNLQRQVDGYTGLDKCPECHRDLAETDATKHFIGMVDGKPQKFCKEVHATRYEATVR